MLSSGAQGKRAVHAELGKERGHGHGTSRACIVHTTGHSQVLLRCLQTAAHERSVWGMGSQGQGLHHQLL